MMTFKLESFVAKIKSPVLLISNNKEEYFETGADLAAHDFSKRYSIKSLYTKDDKIIIEVEETKANEPFNYAGEAALL